MQAGREIKVKAWDDQKKRMYDGDAIETYDYIITGLSYGKVFVAVEDPDWRELTVIQSTGLHDQNGREIYEGDIVRLNDCGDIFDHAVKWIPEEACFAFEAGDWYGATDMNFDFSEVIGNIYESPELLPAT